ncbi:MAG: hypothetical protein WAM77_26750 [Xanthobacteraceae bacterium]
MPVKICLAGCAGAVLYFAGGYINDQEWLKREGADLAVRAMSSPSGLLEEAEKRLEDGRIAFSVYSDLLEVALDQQDADVRATAFKTMDKLLASRLAFAGDLQRWLASMPPQVFITTTGGSHGSDLEKELKFRGMHVIVKNTDRPKEVTKTAVFCYDPDPCQQTAHSVVDLLQEEGYAVAKPTPPENGFGVTAQDDDATKLFNKKLIDIVLADEKKSGPIKQVVASARRAQPRPVQPKQFVALGGQPSK